MSAGIFQRSRYQASYNGGTNIHPIRVQPETIALESATDANDPPAGAISNPISAQLSRGKRAAGLRPRAVTIQFPMTSQPANYKPGGITRVPILTAAFFDSLSVGTEVTYLGATCEIIGKSPEEVS